MQTTAQERLPKAKRNAFIPLLFFLLACLSGWTGGKLRYTEFREWYKWMMLLSYLLHASAFIFSLIQNTMILGEEDQEKKLRLFPWLFIALLPLMIYFAVCIMIFIRFYI